MRTANRLVITLAVALFGLAAPLVPSAQAQEVQVKGPLAGAPAVIGLRIYRQMRFQIQLHATYTLQDEYSRSLLFGGQLMFHPTDWLGVGLWGGFAPVHIDTNLTDQVGSKGQTNAVNVLSLPVPSLFSKQIAHINWMAAPQVAFIPLRGKLGIFEKLFVDTDFYIVGGVAFVGLEERKDVGAGTYQACANMAGTNGANLGAEITCFRTTVVDGAGNAQRTNRTTIAPTFGVGLSLFMSDFLAMTIEWRAMPFAWNTSGTDESGDSRGDYPDNRIDSKDRLSHFNHMLTLGFAFYLPTEPGRSQGEEEQGSPKPESSSPSAAKSVGASTKKK
ncbi:MAG: hypothetical protein ACHQ53_08785 [Polyangiales bacterium]